MFYMDREIKEPLAFCYADGLRMHSRDFESRGVGLGGASVFFPIFARVSFLCIWVWARSVVSLDLVGTKLRRSTCLAYLAVVLVPNLALSMGRHALFRSRCIGGSL